MVDTPPDLGPMDILVRLKTLGQIVLEGNAVLSDIMPEPDQAT
jgi:hypothetical protein